MGDSQPDAILEVRPAASELAVTFPDDPPRNFIATLFRIAGWLIIIGGTVAGVITADAVGGYGDETILITFILTSIASSLVFFAVAEVIRLLEKIAWNTIKH